MPLSCPRGGPAGAKPFQQIKRVHPACLGVETPQTRLTDSHARCDTNMHLSMLSAVSHTALPDVACHEQLLSRVGVQPECSDLAAMRVLTRDGDAVGLPSHSSAHELHDLRKPAHR